MKTISLICTFHQERGRASVSDLHAILERIQPEVIFLEAPAKWRGERLLLEKINNLESSAVSRYIIGRSVELVPVDLPTPDESYFRMSRYLFGDLPKTSYEYYRLMEEGKEEVNAKGFVYLNSEQHSQYQASLHVETMKALGKLDNHGFSEFYGSWLKTMELRDREMIFNIRRYCLENEFARAAFLVGAAHRASIIKKSKEQSLAGLPEAQWDYSGNGAW